MVNMKICNFVIALITLAIGGTIARTSYGYGIEMTVFGPGPGFWPFILAICLIAIACLILIDTQLKSSQLSEIKVEFTAPKNISVYKMMLITAAFILFIFLLGFYAAVFLFMLSSMYMLGARKLSNMLSVTLAFLAFLYVIFDWLLHINMPLPFFVE